MKIDIVCSSGSPIGLVPDDVQGKGVGGAELALLSTVEKWAERGYEVFVYNNPRVPGYHRGVHFRTLGEWIPNRSDVLIVFRTPFDRVREFKGKKVFWSCDQYTVGNFKTDIIPFVDSVVTISPFHTKYFMDHYDVCEEKIATIGIGVRTWEYEQDIPKITGRVVFCSVPDRGLPQLRNIWPMLTKEFPDLSLTIMSDYRLWGAPGPMNEAHRKMWSRVPNVEFCGKVPRSELIVKQLQAEWMIYPCTYEELFCIAAAECQVAGALLYTSSIGALSTTNVTGLALAGDPNSGDWQRQFADVVLAGMRKQTEIYDPTHVKKVASRVFGFESVLLQWDEVLI